MLVNVADAKAHLSKLIDRVCRGEEVTIAKNNRPLVDLVIHKPKGKRTFGILDGQFAIPDGFFEEDRETSCKCFMGIRHRPNH